MRFLLDENIGKTLATLLIANGYDVLRVAKFARGSSDKDVIALARKDNRILVTYDSDFGELIFVDNISPPVAIIYLRIDPADQQSAAFQIFSLCENQNVAGHFIVVDQQNIRMRLFPSE